MDMLRASVTAGESGPVIVLSGQADITSAEQLNAVLTGQLASGARYLTIDASGLRFADSMAIHALLVAARTLKERGGSLILLRPPAHRPAPATSTPPGPTSGPAVRHPCFLRRLRRRPWLRPHGLRLPCCGAQLRGVDLRRWERR